MTKHRELIAYVRFQLDQLSAHNAQHEFEHMCRHLARLRVCSNILPATGPVAARGDQGRDAESFRSYLANSPALASSTFVGLLSDRPIAFAVTLQKKENNLKGKLKADIAKIQKSGVPVSEIHYFCADDLDVGTRHTIQAWANDTHGVTVQIYDGQAIAEFLCARDTFWIATEYLQVPSEMYPDSLSDGRDDWYHTLFQSWQNFPQQPLTFATFAEVKSALRHCTFTPDHQNDLLFWMRQLEPFLSEDVPTIL